MADPIGDEDIRTLSVSLTGATEATERSDAEAIVEFTHPALAVSLGSKQKLVARVEALMASMKAQRIEILSIVTSAPHCEDIKLHKLCFVPKVTTVRTGSKVRSEWTYVIAVADQETSGEWRFIDGTMERDNPGSLRKFLPWMPASVVMPQPPSRSLANGDVPESVAKSTNRAGSTQSVDLRLSEAGAAKSYLEEVSASVPPIIFPGMPIGNPVAIVEITTTAEGVIVGRRLVRSSGDRGWDEAVQRAVYKMDVVPQDADGNVPNKLELSFSPNPR